ncbi:MAG: YdcF family protein [Candidatus Woesearchaeota archaeon]|jgi:uncharacterized SAM-binding protein YcdF (DUF218 family)
MTTKKLPTILHLGPFHKDKTPMDTTNSRIDKALELYFKNLSAPLIFSAKTTYYGITKKNGWEEMIDLFPKETFSPEKKIKSILLKKGVKSKDILSNNLGLDTVGEIYFIAETILKPNNIKKFRVITSDFHMARCLEMYYKILGKDYKIIPESTFSKMDTSNTLRTKVKKREAESLARFKQTFKNVKDGDAKHFENVLYSKHRRYAHLPEKDKIKFYDKKYTNKIKPETILS